jgi:hypothetical protein
VFSCVQSERGNACFNLFGSGRFGADCIAVRCGCNAGARIACVTNQRSGLPEAQYHNATRTLTDTSAPEPDMTSQAVLAAQPKSAQDALAKTGFRSACGAGQSAKRQARHLPPTEFRPARQFSDQFFSPRRLGLEFHNKAHLTLCERSVRTIDDVACAGQHGSFEIVLCVSRYCALLQCLSPSATRT